MSYVDCAAENSFVMSIREAKVPYHVPTYDLVSDG